jgi:hypothetical protein
MAGAGDRRHRGRALGVSVGANGRLPASAEYNSTMHNSQHTPALHATRSSLANEVVPETVETA